MKIAYVILMLLAAAPALFGGENEIREAYTKIHQSKDIEAFSHLIEFSADTPTWIKNQIIESFKEDSSLKITGVEFIPLPMDFSTSFEYEGVTYVSTLPPKAKMKISFAIEGQGKAKITSTTYTIGEKDGIWRIASAKPRK